MFNIENDPLPQILFVMFRVSSGDRFSDCFGKRGGILCCRLFRALNFLGD